MVFLFLLMIIVPVIMICRGSMESTGTPQFYGVEDLKLTKFANTNFAEGVQAVDREDGTVEFTYDASRVDLTDAGIYYVIYTASDSEGNTATYRRKVAIIQDSSDTMALVQSIAADLEGSAEEIRDYVRSSIGYSSDWGGDNPVWYGLQNKTGNCYVHAMVLDALLREKGYKTQLIWCTDKTHYWNLVYLEDGWHHIDSTPSAHTHSKYSLMSDQQRYETLSGRDWDRTAWPQCP